MADFRAALKVIQAILNDPVAFVAGKPRFASVQDLHQYLVSKQFTLTKNEAFGPSEPEARQLIYQGPNNVIVKVKTQGYSAGPRCGRATMSFEVTDGKGDGWENALFKVNAQGKVIPKNLINASDLGELEGGGVGVTRAGGKVAPIVKFEVIQGGRSAPFNKQQWADAGHLDFSKEFDIRGSSKIANPAANPHIEEAAHELPPQFNPVGARNLPRLNGKLVVVGKYAGAGIAMAGIGILVSYLRGKLDQDSIERQIRELQPKIHEELQKHVQDVLAIKRSGRRAFANITVEIMTITTREPEPGGPPITFTTLPVVELTSVVVSDQDLNGPGHPRYERNLGGTVTNSPYTFSVEVGP